MKGPSYSELGDIVKFRTTYQYFCPRCKQGPFFTKSEETACLSCSIGIKLLPIDGDILVQTIATNVKTK